MSTLEIVCEHCQSRYQLPAAFREVLRGSLLTCVVCTREWTPLPADERGILGAPPELRRPTIALHQYLQGNPYGVPESAPLSREAEPRPGGESPRPVASSSRSNLRIVATGPGLDLDAVFELGDRSFFIGTHDCHLDLFHAPSLPERAIRLRTAGSGFEFEGVSGFLIPLGPVSVAAGRLDPGSRLEIALTPYRISLEPTARPGGPIRPLEEGSPPPAVAVPSPAPAAAPAPAPPPPAEPPAPEPKIDTSSTVRGLGALGFDTRRFADPLADLDVGLLGVDPPIAGETLWLKKSPTLVGRTTGDLLIADTRVSGKHAQIDVLSLDQYSIRDLASTNGTTVNGRPASTTRLKDGDVISFGGVRAQFVVRPKRRKEL